MTSPTFSQHEIEQEIARIQSKYPSLKNLKLSASVEEAVTERTRQREVVTTLGTPKKVVAEKMVRQKIPSYVDPKLLSNEEL